MHIKKIISLILSVCIFTGLFVLNVSAAQTQKGVTLNKSSISVSAGKSYSLKAVVTGFKSYTLSWNSSNKSVVSVASGGKITAKSAGSAVIKVSIKGTSYSASCKVTVKDSADKSDTISTSNSNSSNSSSSTGSGSLISSKTTAAEFVKKLKIGWNLGNSLDATGGNGLSSETSWGNPITSQKLIDTVKKSGFNTIRIPVSWGNHLDSSNNIDSAWMARVKEVVDYAIDNELYVILNTHHEGSWLIPSPEKEKAITAKYTTIWKQIAKAFGSYDEHLIFEGMNEPRTEGSAKEWIGGTAEERDVVNNLNQAFVDTVRGSGGNNKNRFLMITPYAASVEYAAMSDLKIPDDNKIIVSIHSYAPFALSFNYDLSLSDFNENGKKEINSILSNMKKLFIDKGVPVIIGECGSINKGNDDERIKAAEYFVSEAKKLDIVLIYWDNGHKGSAGQGETFGLMDRNLLSWYYPKFIKSIVDSAK